MQSSAGGTRLFPSGHQAFRRQRRHPPAGLRLGLFAPFCDPSRSLPPSLAALSSSASAFRRPCPLVHAVGVCPAASWCRDTLALSELFHHGRRRARTRTRTRTQTRTRTRSRAAVSCGRRMAWTKSCLSSTCFQSFSQSMPMTRTATVATQVRNCHVFFQQVYGSSRAGPEKGEAG